MTGSGPPVAPRGPGADPYAWMRDRDQPQLREYLAAERAYYDEQAGPLRALREDLFAETGGAAPAGRGVGPVAPGRVLVLHRDRGRPAARSSSAGPRAWMAPARCCWTTTCSSPIRPPAAATRSWGYARSARTGGTWPTRSTSTAMRSTSSASATSPPAPISLSASNARYYGAGLGRRFPVPALRGHRPRRTGRTQVWRHELGTAPGRDSLVYREDDERFELTVRATRSGAWLLIETASRNTTETLLIPADDTGAAPFVIEPRRPGTEYFADHASGPDGGELYLVTNAGAPEFRLVRAPVTALADHGAGRGPVVSERGGRRSSGRPRTPGWWGATCSAATWSRSSAAAPRPSCAWWTARPGRSI